MKYLTRHLARASGLTTLRTLRLQDTQLPPKHLQMILGYTNNLQDLSYGYHLLISGEKLRCEELQSALDLVKGTLKHLKITCRFFTDGNQMAGECEGRFVSNHCTFKDFPVLSSLHISPEVLLGWHHDRAPEPEGVLPSSLIRLSLRPDYAEYGASEWEGADLERWLGTFFQSGSYRRHTPHWRTFEIWNTWPKDCIWIDYEEETYLNELLCSQNPEFELTVRDGL